MNCILLNSFKDYCINRSIFLLKISCNILLSKIAVSRNGVTFFLLLPIILNVETIVYYIQMAVLTLRRLFPVHTVY
jgi:hypothetical protein